MKKHLLKKFNACLPVGMAFIVTAMLFSVSANAQIVYTDVNPDNTISCSASACSNTFNVDLNNDGNLDFKLTYTRTYLGPCGGGHGGGFTIPRYTVNKGVATIGANSFYGSVASNPSALNDGAVIDSNLVWTTGADTLKYYARPTCSTTSTSGNWNLTTDQYLPVKISVAGNNYFGWIRMQMSSIFVFVLKDYAYNSIPNQPILAGQTCPPKVVVASVPTAFCSGDSLLLRANTGMCSASSLLWSTGETTTGIVVKTNGTYGVTLIDTAGNITSDSITVALNPVPTPTVNASGTLCLFGSVTLSSSLTGTHYLWSNGATSQSITVDTAGNFSVAVTYANGCIKTSTATSVTVNPLPVVHAGNPITISQGNSSVIGGNPTATGNAPFTYSWTPTTGLDSSNVANPTASPMDTTVYTVMVTDANGCNSLSSVKVSVNPSTGIVESANGIGLLVFPNPANDLLNVTGAKIENGEYSFELKNVFGQTMFADKLKVSNHSMQSQFSISEFSNGMYFLIIEHGKSKTVTKVQKMN